MQSIRQVARLNETELEKCIPPNASWHTDYRDTAYIYIGGLPFELSEGDILTIFSQYGNPVHINLVRDKDTGKSRGFAFLKYEDQRSCDLAVDNLSGAGVMGRVVSVDHTRYKMKEGEVEGAGLNGDDEDGDVTDREGDSRRKRRRKSESESEEERPMIKEEVELQKLLAEHDEDDPMKAYLVEEKRAEVAEALKGVVKKGKEGKRKQHHHRSRREDGGEDGERRKGHRSRRERSGEEDEGRHRSRKHHRRDRSGSPSSSDSDRGAQRRRHRRSPSSEWDADRRRRKHRSRKEDGAESERQRRRNGDDELPRKMREHSLSDRSRSRERRRR